VLGLILPGAEHLQNLHPLVVHYPLAFLTAAVVLYPLAWIAGRDSWAGLAFWLLVLGAVSAAAAAGTGLYAEEGVMVSKSVRAALLDMHEDIMLGVLGLSVVLAAWAAYDRPFPARGRAGFVFLLLVLGAALARGADYGGRMVYDYNAGGNACSQPIEFSQ
jgi:uncharacterized membrane protein